jgi:hypothetical protein
MVLKTSHFGPRTFGPDTSDQNLRSFRTRFWDISDHEMVISDHNFGPWWGTFRTRNFFIFYFFIYNYLLFQCVITIFPCNKCNKYLTFLNFVTFKIMGDISDQKFLFNWPFFIFYFLYMIICYFRVLLQDFLIINATNIWHFKILWHSKCMQKRPVWRDFHISWQAYRPLLLYWLSM